MTTVQRKLLSSFELGSIRQIKQILGEYLKAVKPNMGMKHLAWPLGGLGEHYAGAKILGYGPVYGSGAAVVAHVSLEGGNQLCQGLPSTFASVLNHHRQVSAPHGFGPEFPRRRSDACSPRGKILDPLSSLVHCSTMALSFTALAIKTRHTATSCCSSIRRSQRRASRREARCNTCRCALRKR